jgi:O-succinylbenzoic acid--CoA ligase
MLVPGWLQRAASNRPGGVAIETARGSMTYGELLVRCRAGVRELENAGVVRGHRVAVVLPPGLAFAHALHSCLLLGAVTVPVDVRLARDEREAIAGSCDLVVDAPLGACGGQGAETVPDGRGEDSHDLDAPAAVIHTSGTTAAPRPVTLTYGNFHWSALGSAVALGLDPGERWLCAMPVSHVGGLSILIRSAIYGTTAVVHERFETQRVAAALAEERITLVSLVGTTLARLLEAGLARPPALRCALTGGGPVAPGVLGAAADAGIPVRLTYGLTESCSQATTAPVADGRARTDAGPPLFCTQVRIGDQEEILLRGPTVAPAAVAGDGWLHTGDAGSLDEAGRLVVHGRLAETIITGGENVSPVEVEAVLEAVPGVTEAGVFAVADERWGEAVAARVVVAAGAEVEIEQLLAHCRSRLAAYKIPKLVRLTERPLPRTPSGKLLRRELDT